MEFQVEDDPDPLDIEFLETQIRREASAAMGLGDEVELAIFVREAGRIVAGISGWTWGDCCELRVSGWSRAPEVAGSVLGSSPLRRPRRRRAAARRPSIFTYDFQARRLYEWAGYELVGRVDDFPSGAAALWYRKHLNPREAQRDV